MPAPRITIDGQLFRDLNKNGKLDVYEDARQPIEARVDDLLGQMNVAEKAGLMFQNFVTMNICVPHIVKKGQIRLSGNMELDLY